MSALCRPGRSAASCALAALLLLVAVSAGGSRHGTALAADPIDVERSEATVDFPNSVTFHLAAKSDVFLRTVSLEFRLPTARYGDYLRRVVVTERGGTEVDVSWTWQLGSPSLPPGAEIRFRWALETDDDRTIDTPDQSVTFDDTRFDWETVEAPGVVVSSYAGDEGFAGELAGYAAAALVRISSEMHLQPDRTIRLFVYDSQESLLGALLVAPMWVGGVAFGEFDTVLVAIRPGDTAWAQRSIAHELSHQVTYQLTHNPSLGSNVPPWLNEGLAVVAEQVQGPEARALFEQAVAAGSVPSLRSLASTFSDEPHLAGVEYAASESVVRFLVENHGPERIRSLLAGLKEGLTINEALVKTYGFDQDGLDDLWRQSLQLEPRWRTPTPQPTPAATLTPHAPQTPRSRPAAGSDPLQDDAVRTALVIFGALGAFLVITLAVTAAFRRG